MKPSLFLLLICLHLPAAEIGEDVREAAQSYTQNGHAPGMVISLINKSGVAFYTSGRASQNGPPLTEHSLFEIGGVTHSFTGLLLAQTVLEEKADLDDSISKYLAERAPEIKNWDKEITLKLLATHGSSLPNHPNNLPANPDNPYTNYSVQLLYEYLSEYKTPLNTGLLYKHSHLGMGLLGHILSLIHEKDYNSLVQEKIAVPLNMVETGVQLNKEAAKRLVPGFDLDGSPTPGWTYKVLEGSGALKSSAHDMTLFLKEAMGGHSLGEAMNLSQSSHFNPLPGTMKGLGWQITFSMGNEIIWQKGQTGGYASFAGFNKTTGVGAVVLANAPIRLENLGMHMLVPMIPLKKAAINLPLNPELLAQVPGFYGTNTGDVCQISQKNQRLYISLKTGEKKQGLYLGEENQFYFRGNRKKILFSRDPSKAITGLTLRIGKLEITAQKLPPSAWPIKPVKVKLKTLAAYPGVYQLASSKPLKIELKDDQLTAHYNREIIQLIPTAHDIFYFEGQNIRLQFKREGKEIKGLTMLGMGEAQEAERK